MTAPERITMLDGATEATFPYGAGPIEYIRADIADAERDAAFAMGVGAAIKPLYQSLWPILGGNNLPAEMWTGIADAFDEAIRDLAPMTPLQAALQVPEACERNARLCEALFRKGVSPEKWPDYFRVPAAGDAILAKLEAKG